jgi:hypothetical protein
MMIDPTPVYRRTLARWIAGTITIRQVELFVKTKWLTREQADDIYTHDRARTPLVDADPYSPEIVTQYRMEVE